MYIAAVFLSLLAIFGLHAWEEKRKLLHVTPYGFLALAVILHRIEEGFWEFEFFGWVSAITVFMHAAVVWETFFKED